MYKHYGSLISLPVLFHATLDFCAVIVFADFILPVYGQHRLTISTGIYSRFKFVKRPAYRFACLQSAVKPDLKIALFLVICARDILPMLQPKS